MKITKAHWMGLWVGLIVSSASVYASSSVGQLSQEELKRMLGSQEAPTESLDFESTGKSVFGAPVLDWRNVDGINWLGPVMNQGSCGSCVAFSTVATLEAQVSIATGLPWLRPSFSPQALFACGGGSCENGWLPARAARFLKTQGVPDEACMPYTSGSTGEDVACNQRCADAGARSFRISDYRRPSRLGGSIDAVKAGLRNGPLVTTMTVYEDFPNYSGGVYKHTTGKALGGHAISLVGYDSTQRAWLIRNSWGPEWGEGGFAWISWDDRSGVGSSTWGFDVGSSSGHLSVAAPVDREYISGMYEFSAKGLGVKGQSFRFHLKDPAGRESVLASCTVLESQACGATIDTTRLQEGRYEIYAESASLKSQVREFYVINSEPKLGLSFISASGADLSAPLKERARFKILTQSSPVPMQRLEFRVVDENGKRMASRATDYVLEEMQMGWSTTEVPNGQYMISLHGELKYGGKVFATDSDVVTITVKN